MEANPKKFFDRLAERCEKIQSSLCIGLDPDPRRLPRHLGSGPEAIYKFCIEIIEATADSAAAFKPNLAFFESIGVEGWHVLKQALEAVPEDVPVILDAKRGDIGSTAKHYARSLFECLEGDAATVNPYMGIDSVTSRFSNLKTRVSTSSASPPTTAPPTSNCTRTSTSRSRARSSSGTRAATAGWLSGPPSPNI